tara:strand:+ start:3117 stop:3362 length:246 start_codon:yes stop_codon:yes gene_type:complete
MSKLTSGEIQQLTELKTKYNQLVGVIGNIEVQMMSLSLQKEQLKAEFLTIQEEEIKLGKELEEKYGNGTISLENGEFSPMK